MLGFQDDFTTFDTSFWYVSDFTVAANWNQTAWEADYVAHDPGTVTLAFDGADKGGKPFTGSEIQSDAFYSYGTYEVEMQASGESGVVSSFFLFSGTFFGATQHNEIDFEFLGGDTSVVNINYFYGGAKLGDNGSVQVPLGFDAAAGLHTYTIDWQPDSIRWLADGVLLYEVTSETAPVPIPNESMKVYANVWTGAAGLEHWHGPIDVNADTQAVYSSVSYTPYVPEAPMSTNDTVSLAGDSDGYIINLAEDSFARAAKVMPVGDSLTVGHIDVGDPAETPEERDGYRLDLFDHVLASGGWIDYVGGSQNGPPTMMDPDHNALGGESLRDIVRTQDTSPVDLSVGLGTYTPDVVLLMAGTNDFNSK
ncbi:MAG: family 16 glycosylhydrolase, partial [Pseudomonadota bacterium]